MKEKLKTAVKKAEVEIEKIEGILEGELKPREESLFVPAVGIKIEGDASNEPATKDYVDKVLAAAEKDLHDNLVATGELDEHGHLIRPEKAPEHF